MRRLRARLVTARPGRLGEPSAPTTWGCLQWLDADRMNAGVSPRDQVERSSPSEPGSTVPRCKVAAAKRREACVPPFCGARAKALMSGANCVHLFARRRGWIFGASRRFAPSFFRGSKTNRRPRAVNNRGDRAYPRFGGRIEAPKTLRPRTVGRVHPASPAVVVVIL